MLVQVPDGRVVDFGDMPREQIKQLIAQKFPSSQREQAGVAGVPGGLGAPPSGFDVGTRKDPGRVSSYLDPARPSPGDVPGGYMAKDDIPLPWTTQDLSEQISAPAKAQQAQAQVQPDDPEWATKLGRLLWNPEGGLEKLITETPQRALYLMGRTIGGEQLGNDLAGTVDAYQGMVGELHVPEEAVGGKEVNTMLDKAHDTSKEVKAVTNVLKNQKMEVAPRTPRPGEDHPEVKTILDKAAEARQKGQDRRAKALEDDAEIKRQEVTKTQPELPPSPKPLPPEKRPKLPADEQIKPTTQADVQESLRKAEEAKNKGEAHRESAWRDVARQQQEELDRRQKEEEARQDEAFKAKGGFEVKFERFMPLKTYSKAREYIKDLDIKPVIKSELNKKLMPFIKDKILKKLGDMPIHILSSEDVDRLFRKSAPSGTFWGGAYTRTSDTGEELIALNERILDKPQVLADTVLHEAVHGITAKAMVANQHLWDTVQKMIDAAQAHALRDSSIKTNLNWDYIHSNPKEFMAAAFSNPLYQEALTKIPATQEIMDRLKVPKGKRTMWDALVTAVRKVAMGLPDNAHSLMEASIRALQHTIDDPSVKGQMSGMDWREPAGVQIQGAVNFFSAKAAEARQAIERMNRKIRAPFAPTTLSRTSPYYGGATRMAEIYRKMFGTTAARLTAQDEEKLREFYPIFNKLHKGWGDDPAPPGLKDPTMADVIRRIQRAGKWKNKKLPPELERGAETIRQVNESVKNAFSQRPAYAHLSWMEDYFTGIWKESPQRQQFINSWRQTYSDRAKYAGKTGTGKYLKEKMYPTIDDALNAKLEPLYDNPLDTVLQYNESMRRHLAKWHTFDLAREEGLIKFSTERKAPPGWVKLENGRDGDKNRIFIKGGPQFAYASEDQARIWNNMMSPGLDHYAGGDLVDYIRKGQNLFTRATLVWPAFHAMTIGLSSISSHMALALDQSILAVMKGEKPQWKMAAHNLVSAGGAPIFYAWRGKKLNRAYLDQTGSAGPAIEKIIDHLSRANFKTRRANVEWRSTGAGTFVEAYRRGALGRQFKAYGREFLSNPVMKALPLTAEILGRSVDSLFHHFWEEYIPAVKAGAAYYSMKAWMERNPLATEEEIEREARNTVDSMDNRFGQLQTDNMLWRNAHKQIGQLAFLSSSWQTAYLREAGGALSDIGKAAVHMDPKFLSKRVSYMISAAVVTGVAGTIANVMLTGQAPQSLKDLFWPRTGGKNPDGTDERIMLPGHEKDIAEAIRIAESGFAPSVIGRVAAGKMSPFLLFAYQTFMGTDYRGFQVNPTDDTTSLIGRIMENIGSQLTPIPLQAMQQGATKGSKLGLAEIAMGIRKAPMAESEPELADYIDINQRYNQAVRKKNSDARQAHNAADPHAYDAVIKRDMADIKELQNRRKDAWQKYKKTQKPGGYQGTVAPQQ